MKKDVMFTMRMPRAVRVALDRAASRDLRPVTHFVLKVLVDRLVRDGLLREEVLRTSPRARRGGGR